MDSEQGRGDQVATTGRLNCPQDDGIDPWASEGSWATHVILRSQLSEIRPSVWKTAAIIMVEVYFTDFDLIFVTPEVLSCVHRESLKTVIGVGGVF